MSLAVVSWVLWAGLLRQERSMLADLQSLDQRLTRAQAEVTQDRAKRDVAHEQLQQIEAALDRSRRAQTQAWQQLQRRVQALARLPATTPLALWRSGANLADTLADMRLLRHIAAHDRSLHLRLLSQRDALAGLEIERQQQQAQLEAQAKQSQVRRDALMVQRQARQALVASIRSRAAATAALGQETHAARAALGAMVQPPPVGVSSQPASLTAFASPTAAQGLSKASQQAARQRVSGISQGLSAHKGQLIWPAEGPVRVAFGERIDLAYGTITAHNGWDIGAPMGSRVQAIAPGRIVYADWLRGYGQVVIVDHQDALHAVVAHLGSIDVNVGDAVSVGQSLGTVGDTGSLRGPVLYFELRHKGAPIDPRAWLRR